MTEEAPKQRPGLGCWVKPGLFALFLMVLGGWMLANWAALNAPGRVVAIVLVVFGAIVAVPVLLWLAFLIFISRLKNQLTKDLSSLGEAGKSILNLNRTMYGKIHEYRMAQEEDFDEKGLDRDFYARTEEMLTQRGFRVLGDLIDQTIEDMGQASPVIRVMVSESGTTTAAFYDISKLVGSIGSAAWACDVTTEFTDGSFLMTNNLAGLNMMTPPPKISYQQHVQGTSIGELLDAHEAERVRMVAEGKQCVVIRTREDAIASERRQQQVKNNFRAGIGYADEAEVKRIAVARGMGEVADAAAESVREAKEEGEQPI